MFILLGESSDEAKGHAASVIAIESDLAKASSSPVELRDVNKNYNKVSTDDLIKANPVIPWRRYLNDRELSTLPYSIVGQPEFFRALNKLLTQHSLADWKSYMRWHLLNDEAPYLHKDVEEEHFNFYGKVLSGQEKPAPRWVRAVEVVKANLGEAIGQLYVEKYFTDDAKTRIHELINNLRLVFRDRLKNLSWMSEATRAKALAKLDSMQQKIGCPDKFRNYSSIQIRRDDYLANVRRCNAFEIHRKICQVGKPVDRSEWAMMPTTADCYNNPRMNEIVFPAGQLQPPFFDISMDDAVNYGGIGVMIGHEITHGFDDQGRHYDAAGNLSEWWTDKDAQEFEKRAQRVISQYDSFEALPGLHVNGKLTLGENIGDLGGVKIAYYALERALEKDPSKRKIIDGFTPEQRFFISWAQVERMNTRDAELKRLLTVNPHAPGEFRAIGPLVNFDKFFEAFGIKNSDPMWRKPEQRTEIW
jgi:putative endopeptidase